MPRGLVLTATGAPHYRALAEQAAASFRRHNTGVPVDLYTDQPVTTGVFDDVRVDPAARRHTKVDALLQSRFERTLYIDSDTLVLAWMGDVFDVLERFDVALTHDQFLANPYCAITYRKSLPAAFPQFNGGVLALRRTPATQAFLRNWKVAIADHGVGRDQPSLRELLWDSDLRIATLPPEYNMMNLDLVRAKPLDDYHAAPRLIHNPHFHLHYAEFRNSPDPAIDSLGLVSGARLQVLLRRDRTLRPGSPPGQRASRRERLGFWAGNLLWMIPRIPRYLRFNVAYQSKRLKGFVLRRLG